MVENFNFPVKLEIRENVAQVTARGGLVILLDMLVSRGVLAGLPETEGSPGQGWLDGQMVLTCMLLNLSGLDRSSDIDRLEEDAGLCALVRHYEPALLGLSRQAIAGRFRGGRGRCFPSARAFRDWLDGFHVGGMHDFERVRGEARIPGHCDRHELFREVNRRLMADRAGAEDLTIDLDATIVASGKRECLATYRAAEGTVPGERGYQPLVAFCRETGMVPWLELRDGNVPASKDNRRALEETLAQLPDTVRRVTLRTDGAGYQEELIRACNDPEFRGEETRRFGVIGLICGASRSKELMAEVAALPGKAWKRMPTKGLECAELPFVSGMVDGMKRSHVVRYVVTRRALPDRLGVEVGELPRQDGRPAYEIRAYMTNLPSPEATAEEMANGLEPLDAAGVVAAAHDRCGHGEEVHSALKSDLAGGMMPSGRFGANAAWLQLAAISLNAMALIRRKALGSEWHWTRMKRIRAVWLNIVARIVRHGRRIRIVFGTAGEHLLEARHQMMLSIPPPAPG